MRVAALYDIHANLPALRAVLADAAGEGVNAFVIGGDVAAGPMPRETIEQLMALGARARFVRGNADREVVEAHDRRQINAEDVSDPAERASAFAASQISPEHRDFLAGFRPRVELAVEGIGPVLFCHGSPRSDTEIITVVTPDARLRGVMGGVAQPLVVCGHTHQQFDREIDGTRLINAGSVGVPYEGRPGAYWALIGPVVQLRRTEYDMEHALAELRASGFPDLEEMLRESLLEPLDPREVSEFFERQAISGS
jgi:predicted phosphodiesterase